MTKLLIGFATALTIATASHAQTTDPYQIVGFSTAEFQGDRGVLAMSVECWTDFGEGARLCTSEEVLNTSNPPGNLGPDPAWVRPIFQPFQATSTLSAYLESRVARGSLTPRPS